MIDERNNLDWNEIEAWIEANKDDYADDETVGRFHHAALVEFGVDEFSKDAELILELMQEE